uniref:Copper sensory histidine kinase CusS n=1 Tax=Klebsiella pneumoniae TaxID=573 RepID=A0A8B0STY5_KLEPN|nr:Copper sensory histidine kinase CusS [Klebsiella pneumoniae]
MFDLRAEVMKVFEFFSKLGPKERNITLKFNGMPCTVEGDPQMFRRAINNLLSNALRYTPGGTGNHRLNKRAGELFLTL